MRRFAFPALAALLAAGCGQQAGDPGVSPGAAKRRVERAADVRLAAEPVPGDAREEGLRASFSNAATVAEDEQVVALFVLEDAEVADAIGRRVRASAPKAAELIVHDELMVVYAAAGSDHTAAVRRAVEEAS